MHSAKNQQNSSDKGKKGDDSNYINPKKRYEKLGSAGIEGSLYQINLLTLVFLNALRKVKNWRLSTEDKAAPQFDDLIFEYLPSESAILLQAKHKKNEREEITYQDLMTVNSKGEFSLPKYFFSFQKVRSKFNVKNVVICTNLKLDEKTKSILKEESVDSDSVLHFEGAENTCYGFSSHSFPNLKQNIIKYQAKNVKTKAVRITDEDIDVYLNHLKFFPICLGDKNVENIIQQTIYQVKFPENMPIKMVREDIRTKMTGWFTEKKGRYLTEVEAKAFFCDMRSNKFCEDMKRYDIRFENTNLPLILQTQQKKSKVNGKDPKQISHIIPDKEYMLNVVKIYQALPTDHKDKTLFVNPEETFEVQQQIIGAFEVQHYTILVIVCSKNWTEEIAMQETCHKVTKVLKTHKYKHVILIAEEENDLATQIKRANMNYFELITDSMTFVDLEETTQEEFKRKKLVNFQGSTTSLEELLLSSTEDLNQIVNSEIIGKLARGEVTDVGLKLPQPDNYYISRSFKFQGQHLSEEELWRSTEDKVILISDSAGTGKSSVLTSLATIIKSDSPHLWVIRLDVNNYTNIMWTLKQGRTSATITELLNSQETSKIKSEFGRKLFETPKRVVLMLDGVDEISPTYTDLVVNLIKDSLVQVNMAKIFVTTRPHVSKEFRGISELQSEPSSKNHEKEIPDPKFFTLEPFSKVNQINFLKKYWTDTLDIQDDVRKHRCEIFAEVLITKISMWIEKGEQNQFAGIPLQTRMLGDIFKEKNEVNDKEQEWEGCKEFLSSNNMNPKLPTRIGLTQLYEMFIDKKHGNFIKTCNPGGHSYANEALEDKFEKCQKYHRALALEVIFDSDNLDHFTCYTNVESLIPSFEDIFLFRVGIVQRLGERIEFLHRTFAEFFVVDCLLVELEQKPVNKEFQQFFMNSIMLENRYYMIRAFLDSRMKNVWHLIENNLCNYFHENHLYEWMLQKYFNACAKAGCVKVFECILKCIDIEQHRTLSKTVQQLGLMYWTINSATRHGHLNIIKLLLELNETFNKGKNAHKKFIAFIIINAVTSYPTTFQFLSRQVDENDKNTLECSPPELHEVAFMSRFGKVELWVEKAESDTNINDNIRGSMTIRGALSMSGLEAVTFVMEKIGVDINDKYVIGGTALHIASSGGSLEIVKYLVERAGADMNVKNGLGNSALHEAAIGGKLEIVKYLVEEAGADINAKTSNGKTVLHASACWDGLEIVKYLVEEVKVNINVTSNSGETALHEAFYLRHLRMVKYLIEEAGADINVKNSKGNTILLEAAHKGQLEIVKYLVEKTEADISVRNSEGKTAFDLAVSEGQLEIIKYLVQVAGADINVRNSKGNTILHETAHKGQLEIVKYLVEKAGADISVKNSEGKTAFDLAVSEGQLEIIKYLVQVAGVDVNVRNSNNETALHRAAYEGQLEIVKFLVEETGADINVKDGYGMTALYKAVFMGKLEIVKYLVEDAKVNKLDKDYYGNTALHAAAYKGEIEVARYLLEQAGVDKDVKNSQGKTAARVAADQAHWKLVEVLLNCFAIFKMKTIQFFRGNFPCNS